jgi:hypothetical protein
VIYPESAAAPPPLPYPDISQQLWTKIFQKRAISNFGIAKSFSPS